MCKEAITSLTALGYTGEEVEAPVRTLSDEFPYSMSTSKKRKREVSPEGYPFGEPFNTSTHYNAETYMQLTGRGSEEPADPKEVLGDPGMWALEALANLNLNSQVFSFYCFIFL